MVLTLYYAKPSPAVRAVLLNIKALGLNVKYKEVNLLKGAHYSPEYTAMNPQRTIPTLDDDGFILWDSHAINAYLVSKYGKTDGLYPKDLKKRAIIDQRLHFDSGILFPRGLAITFPILFEGATSISEDHLSKVLDGIDILDTLIGSNKWVAGNEMSIADFSCVATVSTAAALMMPDIEKRPNVFRWLKRCESEMVGYKEANQDGANMMAALLTRNLKSHL